MNKNKNKIYKNIVLVIVVIISSFCFINSVYAMKVDPIDIYSIGECGALLKYKGTIVKVSYVQYINEGIEYPAYCLDKTKPGVETSPYSVFAQNIINDVGLWRRVINGYPYKTIQELGVENKLEAFTATKQAIYCYIHGNDPNDYEGIGEAGERTLNAMKKIIEDSQNSRETKISNNIEIKIDDGQWQQDITEKDFRELIPHLGRSEEGRYDTIVSFTSLLQMMRDRYLDADQKETYGRITVRPGEVDLHTYNAEAASAKAVEEGTE